MTYLGLRLRHLFEGYGVAERWMGKGREGAVWQCHIAPGVVVENENLREDSYSSASKPVYLNPEIL